MGEVAASKKSLSALRIENTVLTAENAGLKSVVCHLRAKIQRMDEQLTTEILGEEEVQVHTILDIISL